MIPATKPPRPTIYVQHPAVNGGERLLLVVAMLPRIDELADGHPQQIKMTLLPRSICSEAHQVFHRIYEWDLKKGPSMRMWTENNADLGGPWVIASITDRVVTLEVP